MARALGQDARYKHVSLSIMTAIIGCLTVFGLISRKARDKAELAKIGRYYATESMLVFDHKLGRYSAEATPETGQDRLEDFYRDVAEGRETVDLGDHAVF